MKKIRILIIQGYGFQRGGTVTFLRYIANLIDKKKFEPVILFLSKGELVDEFQKMKLDVRVISSGRLLNIFSFVLTIFRILFLIYKERINLVFSNDGREHIYGGTASYLAGVPATFFWHSFFAKNLFSRLALSIPIKALFTNNKEKKNAIEKHFSIRNVHYIRIGVEIPDNRSVGKYPSPDSVRHKMGVAEYTPLITQISHFIPWKGHKYFIKAIPQIINHFPKVKFLIVGSEPSHIHGRFQEFVFYKQELKKCAKDLKLENSIVFLEYIENRSKFLEILQASDIIIHPAVYEDYGITILEAMSYSKTVIATNAGGPKEIIEDGIDGILVPPKDSNAIAKAILTLLKDKELCRTMGNNARKKVETYFRAERMVKEIEDVWLNLVLV